MAVLDPNEKNRLGGPGPQEGGTTVDSTQGGDTQPSDGPYTQPPVEVAPPPYEEEPIYLPDGTRVRYGGIGAQPPVEPPVLDPLTEVTPAGPIDPAAAGQAEQVSPDYLAEIGATGPTTREVTDDELVSSQLEGLLSSNSPFLRNARKRAAELAASRGQFGSSMMAGAAERAAVESALPIAQADAQAFRDAAAQNLSAMNQNAIAQLQRVTALETTKMSTEAQINMANLDAGTRISMANLDAMTRIDIANLDSTTRQRITEMTNNTQLRLQNMQDKLAMTMQTRSFKHEGAMERMRQDGRVELANMDASLQAALQERGFNHDFNMADLNHAQRLEVESLVNEYNNDRQNADFGFQRTQSHANAAMQVQMNYMNYLSSFAGTEMDADAATRLQKQADAWLVAQMDMVNGLYPEQDPINIGFESI